MKELMTVIYSFFGHFNVFLVWTLVWTLKFLVWSLQIFTSARVAFKLLHISVEKPLLWRLQTGALPSMKKSYLFGGELLLSIRSINKFLEKLSAKLT